MPWRSLGVVLAVVLLLLLAEHRRHQQNQEEIAHRHAADCRALAERTAQELDRTVARIHDGLRTMARLPGVRRCLGERRAPEGDALVTIQEVYNALATDVAMSEVYLVSHDLDPDRGPVTAPVATFDQLIVDRPGAGPASGAAVAAQPELEEVEIHEYRLMRSQLAWFAAQAGVGGGDGLRVPVRGGPPVNAVNFSRPSAPPCSSTLPRRPCIRA
jgi:hypothetical protein